MLSKEDLIEQDINMLNTRVWTTNSFGSKDGVQLEIFINSNQEVRKCVHSNENRHTMNCIS